MVFTPSCQDYIALLRVQAFIIMVCQRDEGNIKGLQIEPFAKLEFVGSYLKVIGLVVK